MIIRNKKKGYFKLDEPLKLNDHGRPVTRREFIQQGFMTGAAAVTAPSLLGMLAHTPEAQAALAPDMNSLLFSADCGGRPSSTKIPFICFDLAGGANIAGSNVLVGTGNQTDFLSTAGYDRLGVPGDMIPNGGATPFFNTDLGLAFHNDSAFYKGIMDSVSLTTAADINGAVIAARSDNDTGNNPHNPMFGIQKAGQDGQLLTLIGSRNSDSGGNSVGPMSLYDPNYRPTKIDRPSDAQGLVDTGELAALFQADSTRVMEAIQRLSDKKLDKVNTGLANDLAIKKMISCGYVKSADQVDVYGDPSSLNPTKDLDIVDETLTNGDTGIFSNAEYFSDSEFRKTASVMKLVVNGFAGAGTITMGGYDYHTGDRITGELRDYRAGRCMGACLEYAARKGKKLMLYVFSDGSVSSNGRIDTQVSSGPRGLDKAGNPIYDGANAGKGEWTSDNSGTACAFFLVYNPGSRPQLISADRQQIGYFTSNANVVTSSSPAANNVTSLVDMAVLNYMALNDDVSQFASTFSGHGLGSNIDDYICFNPIA